MDQNPQILIVEDDEARLQDLYQALETAGYHPVCAHSGQQALELAVQRPFDLALVNLGLADISGLEVCRRIKAVQPAFVVMLTGVLQGTESPPAGGELDLVDGFIQHDIPDQDLLTRLRAYLRLQQTQAALQASEARFRHLYESMIDGYGSVDLEGRFLDFNEAFLNMLGYTAEELRQLTYFDITPEKWRTFEDKIVEEQILKRGYSDVYEKEYRRKDGTVFPVELHTVLLHDESGKPTATWAIVRDISQRKQSEMALRESEERFRSTFENNTVGLYRTTPEGRILLANSAMVHMLGFEDFTDLSRRNLKENYFDPNHPRSEFQRLIETQGEVKALESAWKKADGSFIYVRESARVVVDQAGKALYYEGTVEDITQRKKAEQALEWERYLLHALMDNIPDGIYFKDLQSRFFLVNRAMHMTGLNNIEEIYGKTDFDFFEPESARLMYEREQEVMRTGQPLVDLEEEEKWPDRPTTWALTTIMPLRDAKGSIIGIFGVSRGITERKQVEKALRESETRLKEAERMAHLGSFTWEVASDTTIWSDEMYRIAGLEPGATTPRLAEVAMAYTPESWARFEPALHRLVDAAEPFDMAGERIRPDGSLCYVHMICVPEKDASGQVVRMHGTLQDISELRRAQENLQQAHQQLNAIIQASPLGISALDGDGRLTLWSPACERLYGWTQAEVLGQEPPMASEELHVEVRQQIRQELQGTQRSGEVYSRRRKDGTLLDISLSTAPLRDSLGNITGSMAIVEDITQRRRAEEALRESETKFRAIFENSRDAIDVSQAGLHVYVNPAFLQLFGYSGSDEIDGQSLFNLVAPEDRQRIIEISGKRSLGQDAPDYYETRGLRKDGSQFDMEVKADTYELQGKRYTLAVMRDVTERKQAEEALRRSEERYRMLADNMTDLVWVMGPDLKYTYVSPSTMRQRGYTLEELNTLPLEQQIAPRSLEKVMQLYREILGQANPAASDQPQTRTLELEVYRKDGASYWSETTFSLIQDKQGKLAGILGSGRDVTERKRAEQALRESEERFRTFIEQSAEAVSMVDEEGRLIEWNDSMERLSGLTRQEVAGKFFWDVLNNLIPPERRSQQAFERNRAALIQALQTGQSPLFNHTIEGEVARPDGEQRYTRQTVFPIKTEKGFRLGSVSQDITELKHTEALRLAKETAEMANRAKSEFLANMSHELRTPLNAMIGFSDMLSQQYYGPLTSKQVEYVQDIHESAAYLLALINDILDLSKIEAGRMDLETSRVELKSLFEHSLVMVRERANKHALYLSSNIDPSLEGREFLADERKLRQVLYNLLSNAVKFTPDGGAVDISARLVDGVEGQDQPWVEVSVTDTGIGLTADDLERIFEAFYQVKTPEAGKTPGTGLGLSLVRRMVELHGGQTWAESKGPGWGSRFVFTLPLLTAQPGEEA